MRWERDAIGAGGNTISSMLSPHASTTASKTAAKRCEVCWAACSRSALPPKATVEQTSVDVSQVPCVDGSELARVFFTFAGWSVQPCVRPVSAAHRPLAIMPSADQVPVKSPHSTMHWHMWVVLIAGSAGSALRAVRPPNLHIAPDVGAISLRRECDGFLVALTLCHHGPRHPRDLISE